MTLFLKFKIGNEDYALTTENVIKVIPVITLSQIPETPAFFSGTFDYRGLIVPVIDLSQLTIGKPATIRLSTRIILIHFILKDGRKTILGLITEDMTEIIDVDESALQDTPIASQQAAPYLGPIIQMNDHFIQSIEPNRLFSPEIENMIFLTP